MDIGYPLGGLSLAELKRQWRADFTVFEKKAVDLYTLLSTTLETDKDLPPPQELLSRVGTEPTILIAPPDKSDKSILFGPVRDYQGEVVAFVKIELDRTRILDRLSTDPNPDGDRGCGRSFSSLFRSRGWWPSS